MVCKIQKTERNFVMTIERKLIYEDDTIRLEKISFGKYKRPPVYREILKIKDSHTPLSVKEHKTMPDWYLRSKKLNYLLNEED